MEIESVESMNPKQKDEREGEKRDAGRCTIQSSKRTYAKNRKYHGKNGETGSKKTVAASLKKVKRVKKCRSNDIQGYRLVDMSIFQNILSSLRCPNCHEAGCLYIEEDQERKKGLASMLSIACECGCEKQTYSSHTVENNNDGGTNKGMKPFDVNIRAIYGMRTIGSDHTGLEKLCSILNLPKPMTVKNFNNISNTLRDAAKAVAENSMNAAARELGRSEMITNIGVSVDGSWQ